MSKSLEAELSHSGFVRLSLTTLGKGETSELAGNKVRPYLEPELSQPRGGDVFPQRAMGRTRLSEVRAGVNLGLWGADAALSTKTQAWTSTFFSLSS